MKKTYLFEIGLEEMPANVITDLEYQLKSGTQHFLDSAQLSYDYLESFSTPRRLAIRINGLSNKQDDRTEIIKGPAKKIAQDSEGNWTKAAIGFSKGQQSSVDDIIFLS